MKHLAFIKVTRQVRELSANAPDLKVENADRWRSLWKVSDYTTCLRQWRDRRAGIEVLDWLRKLAVPTISGSYQQKGAGGFPVQHTPPGQSESTLQDPQELELLLPEHCPPPDGGAVTTQAEFRVRRIHLPSLSVTLMDDV